MTSRIVIQDAMVLTLDDDDNYYEQGFVVIEDDRIAAVGAGKAPADDRGDAVVIDGSGKLVMPGLVDLHYHTALGKGYSDHLPLWEYLDTCWYPLIRNLDPEAAYWAAMSSYAESIKCGVTTVNDMYRQLESLASAAGDIGIRAVLSNDVATDEHNLDTLEDNKLAFEKCHGTANGRVQVYIGIEWLPLASVELLRDARSLADDLGTGIHIHLNESLTEVENSKQRFGRRPTEMAYETGILGRNCIAAHCVWLSDTEIGLMKATDTQISHNPSSNAKLGNGVARVPDMLRSGINVGLGHDAAECNNSRDMFEVMKFASLMHRATHLDPSIQPAPDVVRQATRNGSEALQHEGGYLAAGRKADVILIDTEDPVFTPLLSGDKAHIYSHLVFAANGSCVDTTIIDGRIVMQGRELTQADEGQIVREANAAFRRVLERVNAS